MISQLTALKKAPATHKDMAETNRLRIDGTANLLDVAERIGAIRFVTQSMVFGYGMATSAAACSPRPTRSPRPGTAASRRISP